MKSLYLSIIFIAVCLAGSAQTANPTVIGEGTFLPTRSCIIPYAGDAELNSNKTSYVINVEGTGWRLTDEGMVFTAAFKRPSEWNSRGVILRINNAPSSFSVDVNGVRAGYSQWRYGQIEFDITKFTKEFYNELSITVFHNSAEDKLNIGEQERQYFNSVTLISQPTVRIDDILIDARADGSRGILGVRLAMRSTILNNRNLILKYELTSSTGRIVAKGERSLSLAAMKSDTVSFAIANIDAIEAWTAVSPKLYTLIIRSLHETRPIEIIRRQIGFTDFCFTAEGKFIVIGKPVALIVATVDGSCGENELKRIKSARANAVMVSGGYVNDSFYELCDRIGLYVIACADIETGMETPNVSNCPSYLGAFTSRIMGGYHYWRAHPSVVAYISAQNTANGYCMSESYLTYKRAEKRRPLIYPNSDGDWNSDAIALSFIQ